MNGARGALICGALRKTSYTSYSQKMYAVVPEWCPELLKAYKKQRGAIKRYVLYSSISLLFFLAFFGSLPLSDAGFCGCRALW